MTAIEMLKGLRDKGWLLSREHNPVKHRFVQASNSELRRWCDTGSVVVAKRSQWKRAVSVGDWIPASAETLILFPKGHTVTMPIPWCVEGGQT